MKFLLKGSHPLGGLAYPPTDSATTLKNLIAMREAGYTEIKLVEVETGADIDIDGFVEWLTAGPETD